MKTEPLPGYRAVRPAACAGRFYPADPAELRAQVTTYLAEARINPGRLPKAIIAPHAGYIYSGPVAGSVYARLAAGEGVIRRVILVGPSHYESFPGLAASGADFFATPLGLVELDKAAIAQALALPHVSVFDAAHRLEHSLEVQLPFLQVVLGKITLVPFLVSSGSGGEVRDVLASLWGGPETCIVVSSDLSHYLPYDAARTMDQGTTKVIEALDADELQEDQACGCIPIRGFLRAARTHALRCQTLDLRNSGDTAGSRDRVVGYGAYAFVPNGEACGAGA